MEQMVDLGWQKPRFDLYLNHLDQKLQLFTDLSGGLGKPLVVEEFGERWQMRGGRWR